VGRQLRYLGKPTARMNRLRWQSLLPAQGGYHAGVRRMRRIILNALTVLSLLLCVATAGLWVRSYFVSDVLHRVHNGRAILLRSGLGQFSGDFTVFEEPTSEQQFYWGHSAFDVYRRYDWRRLEPGIGWT
jgi:hypothetical protein